MTTEMNTTMDHIHTANIPMDDRRFRNSVLNVGRFIFHFLEMLLAMMIGMPLLFMLRNLIPASSSYAAAFQSGTNLYGLLMVIFMTVPMLVWMIVRGHGWRHSAEMGFAMFAPLAVVIGLNLLGVGTYLPWLAKAGHLGMFFGMLIAMLYRRDHYTGKAGHLAHATHK